MSHKKFLVIFTQTLKFLVCGFIFVVGVLFASHVSEAESMSGVLSPSKLDTCEITLGNSSCTIEFTWEVSLPEKDSAVTSPIADDGTPAENTIVATGDKGTEDFIIPYDARTFYLYNNELLLAESTASSSCEAGTTWDGAKCSLFSPTMCEYANPPPDCSWIPGPNYDPITQCGLVLSCNNPPTMCEYASPPPDCSWIPGPNYDPITQCGLMLSCINPPPIVSISASPQNVVYEGASNISWTAMDAASCSITKGGGAWQSGTSGTNISSGALTSNTMFAINCMGPGGSASDSTLVTVDPPPPIVSIFASPQGVVYNGVSTITYSSTNVTSCFGSGGDSNWPGAKTIGGPFSYTTTSLTTDTTYTLRCIGPGNNPGEATSNSTTVTVAAPIMSGILTPASCVISSGNSSCPICVISSGNSSCPINFVWTTINPEGTSAVTSRTNNSGISSPNFLVASGNNNPTPAPFFSVPYINETIHQGRTFYLYNNAKSLVPTSESPNGSGVTVTSDCISGTSWNGSICAPFSPTATISASPPSVDYGGTSNITWSSTYATSCSVKKAGAAWQTGISGSDIPSGALTLNTTFTATCTGTGGQAISSVTVPVTGVGTKPIIKED